MTVHLGEHNGVEQAVRPQFVSQRTLLSVEEQLAGTTGNLARAQIQLYKALGGGWSPDRDPEPARSTS